MNQPVSLVQALRMTYSPYSRKTHRCIDVRSCAIEPGIWISVKMEQNFIALVVAHAPTVTAEDELLCIDIGVESRIP